MEGLTRRDFLKSLGNSAALLLLASTGGCEAILQAIRDRPVRRCISSLAANDPIIETYKAAISAMQALPAGDLRNWTKQAEIHLNHCPHSNWFFLPWHRAYLFYFEKICQKLTGNQDFALPYWNWTGDKHVPAVFWGGAGNPLFDANRSATQSSVISDAVVGQTVVDDILNEPNFLLFASGMSTTQRGASTYGRLEATPHNSVHGFVGGDMGTFMSPLDPVFWTHHNMIERCWVDWNIVRHHANTNDTTWSNFTFTGDFCDADGNPVNINVLTTLLMPLLSYQYDNVVLGSCGVNFKAQAMADTAELRKFLQDGAAVKFEFHRQVELARAVEVQANTASQHSLQVESNLLQPIITPHAPDRLFLTIDQVNLPKENDFFARVFINKPDANATTPITDPHYAGSFAFFGGDHAEHTQAGTYPSYLVDITSTLRKLIPAGQLTTMTKMDVQIVLVPAIETAPVPQRKFSFKQLRLGFVH
ncbi:MAG: tyrosinase family protein [Gammaproteobacteria bacterium]|nr:tyrosinase family protein [Gammaproteobacteria bacterium]